MSAVLEHIRMEVGGSPAKVLFASDWTSPDADFRTIAREGLASYYKPGTLSIRSDLHTWPDVAAKYAEAIRLVRDGHEVARYDPHDLLRDQNAPGGPEPSAPAPI